MEAPDLADAAVFENLTGETLVKQQGEINGQGIALIGMERCTVMIMDTSAYCYCKGLRDSRVLIGPCAGKVTLEDCTNCVVSLAAAGLALSRCQSLQVYAQVGSPVQLEACEDVGLGPFNAEYAGVEVRPRLAPILSSQARARARARAQARVQVQAQAHPSPRRRRWPREEWTLASMVIAK